MTVDPEQLMAYADGELDPLSAKRIERAIAQDPALAAQVERHRDLRARIAGRFAPVAAEEVPDRLAALIGAAPVALPVRRPIATRWREAIAMAACLVIGVSVGLGWDRGPVTTQGGRLYAAGPLATALDTQLASAAGAVRVPVSFKDQAGRYCRVFSATAIDGIACHDATGWALRQTRNGATGATTEYRQAGSSDAALMADAQALMAGDPLDATAERSARAGGWR